MVGQQQAQTRFDLRSESKQQGAATTSGPQVQAHELERSKSADTDRDVAVVAELGYN